MGLELENPLWSTLKWAVPSTVQVLFSSPRFPSRTYFHCGRIKSSALHLRADLSHRIRQEWRRADFNLVPPVPLLVGFLQGGKHKEKRKKLPEAFICHRVLSMESTLGAGTHDMWDPGWDQRMGSTEILLMNGPSWKISSKEKANLVEEREAHIVTKKCVSDPWNHHGRGKTWLLEPFPPVLAVPPWTSDFTSLYLHFLLCQWGSPSLQLTSILQCLCRYTTYLHNAEDVFMNVDSFLPSYCMF